MVAIAIPSSIVNQSVSYSLEQSTFALYQVARACIHFNVSEIIVYKSDEEEQEEPEPVSDKPKKIRLDEDAPANSTTEKKQSQQVTSDLELILTANLLQYLITPPYLRKLIFKPFGNMQAFKYAKNLPQIPGLYKKENKKIMLGIAVPREKKKKLPGQKKLTKKDRKEAILTPYINIGFDRLFKLKNDATVQTHSQVYIDLSKGEAIKAPPKDVKAYSVRAVTSFSQIFTQSPLPDGYSQTIYIPAQQFKSSKPSSPLVQPVDFASLSNSKNDKLLLLFGSWTEVQQAVNKDPELEISDASALFDGLSKGCEHSRLEDAVTITLARLISN